MADPSEKRVSSRVVWLDRLRGVASIGMIVVHVTHALLREDLRDTSVYRAVDAAFGLVAPTFLFCVGASFAITSEAASESRPLLRHRLVRAFALFALGYAMHPSGLISYVKNRDAGALAVFFEADILQVIAIALAALALLAFVFRSTFAIVATVLAIASVIGAPMLEAMPRLSWPMVLLPYVSHRVPTEFPIAPWIAFALFAAAMIRVLGREAVQKARMLIALVGIGLLDLLLPARDPSHVLATFSIVAFGGFFLSRIRLEITVDRVLSLFGRRSLFLYVAHIAIVYAKQPWSLASIVGPTLGALSCVVVSLAVVAAMGGLAWIWDRLSDHRRDRRRATSSARLQS